MIPLKDDNPTERFPILTIVLILINLAVFGWQLSLPNDQASSPALAEVGVSERDQASIEYGAIPYRITHPGSECAIVAAEDRRSANIACDVRAGQRVEADLDEAPWLVTLFTSMFMHGGLLHIAGNLLFLWVFGNNIEDSMGRPRFVAFYLLGGLAAIYAQALIDPTATTPTIGASGAVAGVLGAYALLHPKAKVLSIVFIIFFFTLIEVPAALLLGIWFVLQFLPAVGQLATPEVAGEGGGVAYFAHVGGFIFGLLAIKLFADRRSGSDADPPYPVY